MKIFEFKKAFKKLEKFFVLNYMDGSEYIIHALYIYALYNIIAK